MEQQTAVEWLESELDFLYQYMAERDRSKLFEQAKAVEKEQIMSAYWDGGQDVPTTVNRCEQYYNQTYENK